MFDVAKDEWNVKLYKCSVSSPFGADGRYTDEILEEGLYQMGVLEEVVGVNLIGYNQLTKAHKRFEIKFRSQDGYLKFMNQRGFHNVEEDIITQCIPLLTTSRYVLNLSNIPLGADQEDVESMVRKHLKKDLEIEDMMQEVKIYGGRNVGTGKWKVNLKLKKAGETIGKDEIFAFSDHFPRRKVHFHLRPNREVGLTNQDRQAKERVEKMTEIRNRERAERKRRESEEEEKRQNSEELAKIDEEERRRKMKDKRQYPDSTVIGVEKYFWNAVLTQDTRQTDRDKEEKTFEEQIDMTIEKGQVKEEGKMEASIKEEETTKVVYEVIQDMYDMLACAKKEDKSVATEPTMIEVDQTNDETKDNVAATEALTEILTEVPIETEPIMTNDATAEQKEVKIIEEIEEEEVINEDNDKEDMNKTVVKSEMEDMQATSSTKENNTENVQNGKGKRGSYLEMEKRKKNLCKMKPEDVINMVTFVHQKEEGEIMEGIIGGKMSKRKKKKHTSDDELQPKPKIELLETKYGVTFTFEDVVKREDSKVIVVGKMKVDKTKAYNIIRRINTFEEEQKNSIKYADNLALSVLAYGGQVPYFKDDKNEFDLKKDGPLVAAVLQKWVGQHREARQKDDTLLVRMMHQSIVKDWEALRQKSETYMEENVNKFIKKYNQLYDKKHVAEVT